MNEDSWSEPAEGPFTATLEAMAVTQSPLYVNVDWLQLLEHHNGDEKAAFEQLGKLRDLLGPL